MVSGGADSMLLMSVIADFSKIAPRVIVVHHCHHGIDKNSSSWLQFVEYESRQCGFLFQPHYLALEMAPGFEAFARKARYEAVMQYVRLGDVVMTAHHRDDQIETILMRLSQGSGLIGWAGIPASRSFGSGLLARPLLSLSRSQLKSMLVSRNLKYMIDPSNQDITFLRNFIRLRFLPALTRILPSVGEELLMVSRLATDHVFNLGKALGKALPVNGVDSVELASTGKLIQWQVRFFAQVNGRFSPSSLQIDEFVRQCFQAAGDKLPEVDIGDGSVVIRKWKQKLYWVNYDLLEKEVDEPIETIEKIAPNQSVNVIFPNGVLHLKTGSKPLELQLYWGSQERNFRLGHKRPRKSLKQLAQTLNVAPWYRRCTPLLAIHDQIIGWGNVDCREHGLISQYLQWEWRFVPRNEEDSSVP